MPPLSINLIIIQYNTGQTNKNGSPYPEVTVVNLPSSLMIVHSNAFVFSTCLLVIVSRYGIYKPYLYNSIKKKIYLI